MGDLETSAAGTVSAVELGSVARELAKAYLERATWLREEMQLSVGEADAKVRAVGDPEWARRALDQPPERVSWIALSTLVEHYPEEGWAAWARIKAAARDDLASGHRGARTLECGDGPWERAQFLAIRAAFCEEWQPRGGAERAMIDQMAMAHACYLEWMGRIRVEVSRESYEAGAQLQRAAYPPPPRVSIAEAMDQAAAMADRFHRMFLRSLRALRDLRRYTPTVVVANAGQVNVSAGPQINLAGRDSAERTLAGERDVDTSD